ncbi:glycosyltransferase family 71 protein [Backusella circina FSU 941]|nr:glycosyltransferase family 71 protein [Backusella circina FSU 941]
MIKKKTLLLRILLLLSSFLFLLYFYTNNNNTHHTNDNNSQRHAETLSTCDNVEINVDNNHRDKNLPFWNSMTPKSISLLNHGWKEFVTKEQNKTIPTFQEDRGIVFVAGNDDTLKRTLGSIRYLRFKLNSTLPIEIWHMEHEEESVAPFKDVLMGLDAKLCDLSDYHLVRPMTRRINAQKQFQVKAAAIINSRFRHVLYLDSDNTPTRDPSFLFDTEIYKTYGALFWPDFWKTAKENKIFELLEIECQDEWEQESGQIVVDKARHWVPLQLSWYMQFYQQVYFRLLNGDKDTFQYAWRALKQPYHLINIPVGMAGYTIGDEFCGHTMLQHFASDDDVLFMHANLMKQIPNHANPKWQIVKRAKSTVVMPYFKMVGSIGCMDYHQITELETFEEVVPGFAEGYFEMGGLAGYL